MRRVGRGWVGQERAREELAGGRQAAWQQRAWCAERGGAGRGLKTAASPASGWPAPPSRARLKLAVSFAAWCAEAGQPAAQQGLQEGGAVQPAAHRQRHDPTLGTEAAPIRALLVLCDPADWYTELQVAPGEGAGTRSSLRDCFGPSFLGCGAKGRGPGGRQPGSQRGGEGASATAPAVYSHTLLVH